MELFLNIDHPLLRNGRRDDILSQPVEPHAVLKLDPFPAINGEPAVIPAQYIFIYPISYLPLLL